MPSPGSDRAASNQQIRPGSSSGLNPISPSTSLPDGQALRLRDVRVQRGGTEILHGINLDFEPDHRYVILGASGSGKSTLIRLLNRLDDPDSGTITLGAVPLARWPVLEVRQGIGLVLQSPRPLPGTVEDNLQYAGQLRNRPALDRDRHEHALTEVGLDPTWLDRVAAQLSGGERGRLAIAMALGMSPEILILDEPTAALDPASARQISDLLARKHQTERLRTIVVTHDRILAPLMGDRGVRLERGTVADVGLIHDVLIRANVASTSE